MSESPFIIEFPGVSTADANRYANDLAGVLSGVDEDLKIQKRRDRADTQDGGATLAIILGTASITALAKGFSAWLARHSGAKIQISIDGTVIASNLESGDAARIAEAFRHG